jgi:tetratricopeptide (TPR) repeat protein
VTILDRYVADLGPGSADIKLPASLMRKRISERVSEAAFSDRTQGIFVGRESDMQALTVVLDAARAGHGKCCVIWGDPGIGKSRLASELGRFAELQGVQLRKVACRRGDAERPLSVFVEAVPMLREMRGALGCSADTLADLQRLTQFDMGSAKQAVELDPQNIFELIRLAIFDLIDAVSEEQCLVLVVEDVQWLDAASARILGQIADWAAKKQLLLLFTSRVRENPLLDACTRSGLVTHHLGPISDEAATALVVEMFDATNEKRDDEFLEWCRGVGDGNPFFLHELVKQWLETKQRHAIPPSITSVVRDRFSRLTAESTQLLQACSILGENSTLPRVERMLQQEPYMLLGALNELSKTSMLSAERKVVGSSPDFKLAPRHDLVATAALEALHSHAKIFLHRRAAETLEAELGGETQDTALLWACAQHWQKAGEREKAFNTAVECATQLLRFGLPLEAAEAFHRARTYCTNISESATLAMMEIDALERAQAWVQLRRLISAVQSERANEQVHDELELKDLHAFWRTSIDSTPVLERALRCSLDAGASPLHRAIAGCLAIKIASNEGRWEQMDTIYESLKEILLSQDITEPARLEVQMIFHTMRGDIRDATGYAERFVNAIMPSASVNRIVVSLTNAGDVYRLAGGLGQARALYEEALDVAKSHRCFDLAATAVLEIVRLSMESGDVPQARARMNQALEYSTGKLEDPIARVKQETLELQLLIEEDRLTEALALCTELLSKVHRLPAPRRGLVLGTAVRLYAKLPDEQIHLGDLVAELEENHLRFRGSGWQDYEAFSLYLGLYALRHEQKASHMLSTYLAKFRRDTSALPADISRVINTLPEIA